MSDLLVVIVASVAAGLLSLSVALILLSSEKLSSKLVKYGTPFAAGVLLMIGFRDLLPEGIAEEGTQVLNATLGAVIIFFLIEKGFNSFHHHHEEDKTQENKTQGWLFVIGDVFHNLIDGITLGGAFLIGRDTGLLATFALISHDIPLEVGEFGNQLRVGFTKKQTIIRNIVSGLTTIVGALLTYQLGGELDIPMGYLYGGIAGFFIYIALSDIVPTIHSSEKARYGLQTGFLLFGLIFGGTVSALAHEYIDVGHNHGENGHHDDHNEEGQLDEDEHSHALLEVNSSLPVPEISINVEEDKKSGYNLFLTTQNFTFNPDNASSEHVDGEGHAHLYINGKKITRLYSKAYYLGDFEKGSYTIVVELSSNDHSVLSKNGNPIQASFELVVGEHGDHDDHDKEGHHNEDDHDNQDEEGHHNEDDHDDHDKEGHHNEDDRDKDVHDEDDHDEDDHDEEQGHDEEAEVFVPNEVPDSLVVLNYQLNEKIEIHFTADSEKEIHVHGYDIHFMVYPDKENVLKINLTIAGEFEIEDHDGGFEFARLVVSP